MSDDESHNQTFEQVRRTLDAHIDPISYPTNVRPGRARL